MNIHHDRSDYKWTAETHHRLHLLAFWKRLQWALVIGFCASLLHIYSHVSLMLRLFSGQILSCVQVVSSFICLQKFVINEGGMGWDDWAGRRELFCLVWFPNSLVVILHDFWWEQWPGQPVSTFIAVWDRIEILSRSLYPRPPSNVPSDWTTLEHVGPLLGLSADYQITQDACWRQVIMGPTCKETSPETFLILHDPAALGHNVASFSWFQSDCVWAYGIMNSD